jgi:hypothetical protein
VPHYGGATALAEAVLLAFNAADSKRNKILISPAVHRHYRAVSPFRGSVDCEVVVKLRNDRAHDPADGRSTARSHRVESASAKAAERISAACPRELPQSSIARFEVMEKRFDEMLPAVKTVPAGLRSLLRLAQRRAKNAP